MAFVRVFRQFPGNNVIADIESVDIIDAPPPAVPLGSGFGTVLVVGEFERFAVNRPESISGANDLAAKFGGLGFPTAFSPHDGAVARKSGGDELWNGNGFIAIRSKKYQRLILCRVDNSAGAVEFSRLACLLGGAGPFAAANSDAVTFTLNGSTPATAIVTGAVAQIDASGASFPLSTLAGKTLELKVDADVNRLVIFESTDTTVINVRDRINAALAQTVASDNVGQLRLSSIVAGSLGRIEVVGGTARSDLGLPTAAVAQVDTYTVNNQTDGLYTVRVTTQVNGVSVQFDADYTSSGSESTTLLRDGILAALQALSVPGVTFAASGGVDITATGDLNITFVSSIEVEGTPSDVTIVLTTPAVILVKLATGNVGNLLSFSRTEIANVITAVANLDGSVTSDDLLRVCSTLTSGTGTIIAASGALLTILGFDAAVTADAADAEDVTIPAGTRVQGTTPDTIWVTMEDIETGTGGGAFSAKVRPFTDTDAALANGIGTVTTIVDQLADGFSVTNAAAVTRLSSSQLDARYATALDATLDLNTKAVDADFVYSARSSDSINRKLLENALAATESGLAPRKCFVSPLIGTSRNDAAGSTGTGVAAQRDERRQYAYPGVTFQVAEIQEVGARGGVGFSDDGVVQVSADGFLASVCSILPPEENAGQALGDTNVGPLPVLALEDRFNPEEGGLGLTIVDYQDFKASGITAMNINQTSGPQYQSDVTSVSPTTNGNKVDGSRRRLADFVIKSMAAIAQPFVKKLNTLKRRTSLTGQMNGFLSSLQTPDNPDTSRISAFSVVDDSSPEQQAAGIQAFNVKVVSYPAMLTILLRVEVGTTVQIDEAA